MGFGSPQTADESHKTHTADEYVRFSICNWIRFGMCYNLHRYYISKGAVLKSVDRGCVMLCVFFSLALHINWAFMSETMRYLRHFCK